MRGQLIVRRTIGEGSDAKEQAFSANVNVGISLTPKRHILRSPGGAELRVYLNTVDNCSLTCNVDHANDGI